MSEVSSRLASLAPELREIARDVLTESDRGRIDVVAVDASGQAVAAFGASEDDRIDVARALAAAAWLEAHLPDWCQIAPDLGIDASAPVRALLVAEEFGAETRAAAERLGEGLLTLLHPARPAARPVVSATPAPRALAAHPGAASQRPDGSPALPGRAPRRPFRTALTDADLGARHQTNDV